jgi:hypothetical protein
MRDRNVYAKLLIPRTSSRLAHPKRLKVLYRDICHKTVEAYWSARNASKVRGGRAGVLVGGVDDETSELHASCVRMADIGERLVARAREWGAIHPEVHGQDVFALMNAAAWLCEHGPAERADRLLRLTIAGMRTGGGPDA